MRIFTPLRSSTLLISFLNQPKGGVSILPTAKLFSPNLRAEFVPHRLSAAVIEPCDMLDIGHAERHREEIAEGAVLAEMEARRVMRHLRGAVLHRLEGLRTGHQFAGRENPNRQLAVRHFRDARGKPVGAGAEPRQALRPGRDHAPFHLALRDGGRGERGCPCRAGGEACEHLAAIDLLRKTCFVMTSTPCKQASAIRRARTCG